MRTFHLTERLTRIILLAALSVISIVTFANIISCNYPDIPAHNSFIMEWLGGDKNVKLYSLYFYVLAALSFFKSNMSVINAASVVLLSAAVVAKFLAAAFVFKKELSYKNAADGKKFHAANISFGAESIMLLVLFLVSICNNWVFRISPDTTLGYLPVNTWHNSTTIFLMPFAVWLFYRSYRFIISESSAGKWYRWLLELVPLCMLTIFIKPSYFFVFAVSFPLYCLIRFGAGKKFPVTLLVVVLASGALAVVYNFVYAGTGSSVAIDPFYVWGYWSANIFLAFICSLVFPLLFLLFYRKEAWHDHLLSYAWLQMLVATIIFIMLKETGGRELHANFGWQTIVCSYILFVSTWIRFMGILMNKKSTGTGDRIIAGSFVMHVLFGIVYLLKLPAYGPR